jgi:hypothetical protein
MTTLSGRYSSRADTDTTLDVRERTGGPRSPRTPGDQPITARADFYDRFVSNSPSGSHMPLDIDPHWDWSNPLNIIPALVLLLVIIAAVALIVG